ncbi:MULTISPECIES: hypothetical protein [unclassified Brevundimonas]|uniref:hypothetical protein n=1 Tax=unclassified Brevundimonas TaxID=2622653 RepID=UPI0025BA82EA|nr:MULTISPECIES: hypothetical protein [unclassified Brevundimonas]
MSAIPSDRPAFPPPAGGAAHALRTSQSAFFRAAMGMSAPVPAATPIETRADTPVRSVQAQESPSPTRYQRPGSLLDIRV